MTRSCLSTSSLESGRPWSLRDDGRREDADEPGRARGGAREGRQVYIRDSSGGLERGLVCDAGLGRVDMVPYVYECPSDSTLKVEVGVDTLLIVNQARREVSAHIHDVVF